MASGGSNQNQKILAILQSGRSLTPLEALHEVGSFRLGARIHELKQTPEGRDIQSELIEQNGKKFCRYWLPQPKGQLEFPAFQPQAAH